MSMPLINRSEEKSEVIGGEKKLPFIWDIAIPANTTASVYLPEAVGKEIKEGNKELNDIKSITGVRTDGNWVIIDLESGSIRLR